MRGCREPLDLCWNDLGWPVFHVDIQGKHLVFGWLYMPFGKFQITIYIAIYHTYGIAKVR